MINTLSMKDKTWVVDYAPRDFQQKVHVALEKYRYAILNWHRRAGKSVLCVNELGKRAIQNPGTLYAYIAPSKEQAKNIVWDLFLRFYGNIPGVDMRSKDYTIIFNIAKNKHGVPSKIILLGADNINAARGMGFDGVVMDEYSFMKFNFWSKVIYPTITDKKGFAIIISTPSGHNDFYRLMKQKEDKNNKSSQNWFTMTLPVTESGVFSPEEIEEIEANTGEDFAQEYLCSFSGSVAGAIYKTQISDIEEQGRIKTVPYDPTRCVHTVWDIGWNDATAIGFFQKVGEEYHLIEYYEECGKNLSELFAYVLNKPYIYGEHFAPWDINKTSQQTGLTNWEFAKRAGIEFKVIKKNDGGYGIQEGINATRLFLPKLYVDSKKAEEWVDYMKRYHKKRRKDGTFDDKPEHDASSNCADMTRYAAVIHEKMYEFKRFISKFEQPKFDSVDPYYLN